MKFQRMAVVVLLSAIAATDWAQSSVRQAQQYTIAQFMNTVSISGNSISDDDGSVLISSNKTGILNAYLVPTAGGEAQQLTQSQDNSVFVISFFPKDKRILFSSDKGGNEIFHLYVREEDGNIRDLTPNDTARATFEAWAYDDQNFFYSSNARNRRFMDVYEMALATFTPKLIYQNDAGYDLGAISPDERYLALAKTITTHNAELYLYDRQTQELKHLSQHTGEANYSAQAFSVDSKSLYFTTDEGSEFAYLKRYDLAAGKTEKVEAANWDIMYAYFSRTGRYRVIAINNDANTEIKILDTKSNKLVKLPKMPNGEITSVGISRSEKLMAFYVNGSKAPNNLYVYDFAAQRYTKLTDTMNPEINPEDLVEAEVVRYKSFDGVEIPSIYYKPHGASSANQAPALVWVHGGPGGQSRLGYSALLQYLVNHGYAVIAVNNRGSSGYGKTFFTMDDLKHGEGDLADCVEAKKFLAATGYIDANKIGIIGGSYGGYMVAAALAFRPEEFAVGVNIFGVTNWLRTLKSIPPWWEAFREALYKEMGNPETDEEYLRRISPLFHAQNIKRPLIVLQGANDPRVLQVESDEIVAAVKANNVPVEYIVFPDEGHGFVKKENQIRGYQAIKDFCDKYLKAAAGL